VSDEKPKNQDSKQDLNPALETEEDKAALEDAEDLLAQEDPDFLNRLNKIKIDGNEVGSAALDPSLELEKTTNTVLLTLLRKPFEFKSNTKVVVIFWCLFILAAVAIKLAWGYKNNFLHQNLFMNSFADLGGEVKEYNPNTETEAFYDNPQFSKNLITISSMNVNVKPSENSGNNPMLALEITAEGLSSDAIVEIKDREAEFKDMLLRHTEDKTYDELTESEGKQILCEQFRDLLNANLTRGQVRRVLIKSFIIKP
jgi:flagellar basal body-associated protein FliL